MEQQLSAELKQQVFNYWTKIVNLQNESPVQHKQIVEVAHQLLAILQNDIGVKQTYLIALIKSKQFEEAIKFIDQQSDASFKKQYFFETAYALHRLGRNEEALKILNPSISQQNDLNVKHLLNQVNYKLFNYQKAAQAYEQIFKESQNQLDQDEVMDLATNYFACSSQAQSLSKVHVEAFCKNISEEQRTYEFYFNLAQVYLKEGDPLTALETLKKACNKAKAEDAFVDDQVRFKVEEMNFLGQLINMYSAIEYSANRGIIKNDKNKMVNQLGTTWFDLSKSIKNNILVEMNINALNDIFELDSQAFKDVVGSLNWKKFAERIKTQLKENVNLTINQREKMQINCILSLVKGNAFDEAKSLLSKTKKQQDFKDRPELQSLLFSIEIYLITKDKKYEEALSLLDENCQSQNHTFQSDIRVALLRSQLLLSLKRQKESVLSLLTFTENLTEKQSYTILASLILRLSNNYKLTQEPEIQNFLNKICKSGLSQGKQLIQNEAEAGVDLQLLETLLSLGYREEAFNLIDKSDIQKLKNSSNLMGLYLGLLTDKDLSKAIKIRRDFNLDFDIKPSDIFNDEKSNQLSDEDCLKRLIEEAMPERKKQTKTKNVLEEMKGGAEVFIPKKRKNKKIQYPKNFDPKNPGNLPDPERWLPKWQRSRFKKMAKKKGMYIKGAQGDALVDTDVTNSSGGLKSTVHIEAATGGNKRRRK